MKGLENHNSQNAISSTILVYFLRAECATCLVTRSVLIVIPNVILTSISMYVGCSTAQGAMRFVAGRLTRQRKHCLLANCTPNRCSLSLQRRANFSTFMCLPSDLVYRSPVIWMLHLRFISMNVGFNMITMFSSYVKRSNLTTRFKDTKLDWHFKWTRFLNTVSFFLV
jgi:hypothetical protein